MLRAANWVDRNEPGEKKLARCLAVYFGREPKAAIEEFGPDAIALLHMVNADGSEVQVASYVRSIEHRLSFEPPEGRLRRTFAIALWHIAKAGLVRDRLVAWANEHAPPVTAERVSLSEWLSGVLLRDGSAELKESPPAPAAVPRKGKARSEGR